MLAARPGGKGWSGRCPASREGAARRREPVRGRREGPQRAGAAAPRGPRLRSGPPGLGRAGRLWAGGGERAAGRAGPGPRGGPRFCSAVGRVSLCLAPLPVAPPDVMALGLTMAAMLQRGSRGLLLVFVLLQLMSDRRVGVVTFAVSKRSPCGSRSEVSKACRQEEGRL